MSSNVEIYSKNYCLFCQRAKELLRIKGVGFVEYEISQDPARAEEMFRRSQRNTVPEIFIDGRLIGGCTDLFELDECGELDVLLGIMSGGG